MRILEQLLAGRDFARTHPAAGQMANFAYLLGDDTAGECFLIDPAWDPWGLRQIVEDRGLRLKGAIATHAHADHVGGRLFGMAIEGISRLLELVPDARVWVHEADADELLKLTGVDPSRIERVRHGDKLSMGETELELLHTPGHTPGAMCVRAGDAVLTGDTLFVGECGRIDLPRSEPLKMWESLNRTLALLPDETVVYPGHLYGPAPTSTIGEEKRSNPNLRVTFDEWRSVVGA
ncbi:MAG: MBL fold metallo-hydrolase [Myxococcales bacterium]|jgi:hydroxyacylglutathione hydrolase